MSHTEIFRPYTETGNISMTVMTAVVKAGGLLRNRAQYVNRGDDLLLINLECLLNKTLQWLPVNHNDDLLLINSE